MDTASLPSDRARRSLPGWSSTRPRAAINRCTRPALPGFAKILVVAALLSCGALPAGAQQPTQAQQNAIRQSCRADYQSNCSGVPTGGKAALQCLQQHAASLSAPCGAAVGAIGAPAGAPAGSAPNTAPPPPVAYSAPAMSRRQEVAVLRGACGADYRRICRGVRPGGGQAMQCLKDNFQSLSGGCRRVLSQAASRR